VAALEKTLFICTRRGGSFEQVPHLSSWKEDHREKKEGEARRRSLRKGHTLKKVSPRENIFEPSPRKGTLPQISPATGEVRVPSRGKKEKGWSNLCSKKSRIVLLGGLQDRPTRKKAWPIGGRGEQFGTDREGV